MLFSQMFDAPRPTAASRTTYQTVPADTYVILTPVVDSRSSRSRKRVVRRVKDTGGISDIKMLLAHDVYARCATVDHRGGDFTPRPMGDILVSTTTGQVFRTTKTLHATLSNGREYFSGRTVYAEINQVISLTDLLELPEASEKDKKDTAFLASIVAGCDLKFSKSAS